LYCSLAAPAAGTAVVIPEAPRPVPEGYRKFSESDYFKFHAEGNTWVPARDICDQEGAHLAVVNSEAEAKFISSIWDSKSDWAFIGTHDLYVEGTYVTIYSEYTKTRRVYGRTDYPNFTNSLYKSICSICDQSSSEIRISRGSLEPRYEIG
jgi:hypothetical protein